jgi:hypothetical protein
MCNRVLAEELVQHTGAEWADFAVCFHPANQQVLTLHESVSSTTDVYSRDRRHYRPPNGVTMAPNALFA